MEVQPNIAEAKPEILIVEDSPTQAEKLKFILGNHGITFMVTRNGREALAAIAKHQPTLIISDVVMPEMDGYQLCQHIKQDQKLKHIPVILLTSLTEAVDVVRGLECGADNFLFKPYDEAYLLARITYILANRNLRENENTRMGVEIIFAGRKFYITSDRLQILNLLLSTYEVAVQKNHELTSTRDQLRFLNENLEAKVAERTAALQEEVRERRSAEEEVRRLNAGLERRVQERTAQLEASNKELEAFSYSVSHDLRTPLRHIDGYMQLLQKSAGHSLNDKSQHYLQTIADAAERMGQLIDDLLNFSRMSRMELNHSTVDLNTVVQEVIRTLQLEIQGRKINWKISPLPTVRGDNAIIRQVYANLLGNALKYSRNREVGEIEIGEQSNANEYVLFVRDNGVGFDMQFSGKLFGVFQRLHRAEDFEGTGIGLANVRRMISRHGGRTWAEGELDKGATFYFSLPKIAAAA